MTPPPEETRAPAAPETLEEVLARHHRELRELQGRITNKKKNATKKTRKGVNYECERLERDLRERQSGEVAALQAGGRGGSGRDDDERDVEDDVEDDGDEDGGEYDNALETLKDRLVKITPTGEPTQSEEQQNQDRGKKRNRQRERLARRAAEKEAAAIKAQEEVAAMPDLKSRESARMRAEMDAHALEEREIRPDGHCLFAAMADQLEAHGIPLLAPHEVSVGPYEPPYRIVRRKAAEHMLAHADEFALFMEDAASPEEYAARIRDTAEWGGHLELLALARVYGVEVRVVQAGRTDRIRGWEEEGADEKMQNPAADRSEGGEEGAEQKMVQNVVTGQSEGGGVTGQGEGGGKGADDKIMQNGSTGRAEGGEKALQNGVADGSEGEEGAQEKMVQNGATPHVQEEEKEGSEGGAEEKVAENSMPDSVREVIGGAGDGGAKKRVGEERIAWLAYYRHGYGLGEHYNSLRKKKNMGASAAVGEAARG